MPNEEAKIITAEMRPAVEGAPLESQPDQRAEQREQRENAPKLDQEQSQRGETSEPAPVRVPAAPAAPTTIPVLKDPQLVELENLLAEDLTDLFLALPDEKKWAFKKKGEETASTIQTMMREGKMKIKKVFELIREWLQMVPGVNKYFLEQEAKIKADKVLQYAQEQEKATQPKL